VASSLLLLSSALILRHEQLIEATAGGSPLAVKLAVLRKKQRRYKEEAAALRRKVVFVEQDIKREEELLRRVRAAEAAAAQSAAIATRREPAPQAEAGAEAEAEAEAAQEEGRLQQLLGLLREKESTMLQLEWTATVASGRASQLVELQAAHVQAERGRTAAEEGVAEGAEGAEQSRAAPAAGEEVATVEAAVEGMLRLLAHKQLQSDPKVVRDYFATERGDETAGEGGVTLHGFIEAYLELRRRAEERSAVRHRTVTHPSFPHPRGMAQFYLFICPLP
jgi:hypothetical protein